MNMNWFLARNLGVFALLSLAAGLHAQGHRSNGVVLKVDENVSGPFGGQKSKSCLRVYNDGRVIYSRWWNSAATIVDNVTNVASRPEHTVAFADQLADTDVWDLIRFLESKAVRKLAEKFGPPHPPVDYFETVSVEISGSNKGNAKKLTTREYYVASLEEKTRYPSALIVLMERIDRIEEAATAKEKPTEIPADCSVSAVHRSDK